VLDLDLSFDINFSIEKFMKSRLGGTEMLDKLGKPIKLSIET
jgi:hypothetical protein